MAQYTTLQRKIGITIRIGTGAVHAGLLAGALALVGAEEGIVEGDVAGCVSGRVAGWLAGPVAGWLAGAVAGAEEGIVEGNVVGCVSGWEDGWLAGADAGPLAGALAGCDADSKAVSTFTILPSALVVTSRAVRASAPPSMFFSAP